jgi:hypothetical protein
MSEYLPFIDARLHMAWVEGVGHGIFTRDAIKSQSFVEIAPVVDFMPDCTVDPNLMKYVVSWEGRLAVSLGWTMMYNHSDNNNCVFSMNFYDKMIAIMAVRDIRPSEQLTVNYGPDWFSSRAIEKVPL